MIRWFSNNAQSILWRKTTLLSGKSWECWYLLWRHGTRLWWHLAVSVSLRVFYVMSDMNNYVSSTLSSIYWQAIVQYCYSLCWCWYQLQILFVLQHNDTQLQTSKTECYQLSMYQQYEHCVSITRHNYSGPDQQQQHYVHSPTFISPSLTSCSNRPEPAVQHKTKQIYHLLYTQTPHSVVMVIVVCNYWFIHIALFHEKQMNLM